MTEKDLGEVEKVKEIIRNNPIVNRSAVTLAQGTERLAQAILTYIRQEEVKLLGKLKKDMWEDLDEDVIQQAISRIEKGE